MTHLHALMCHPPSGRHIARSDVTVRLWLIARRPCPSVKAEGPPAGPYVPGSCRGWYQADRQPGPPLLVAWPAVFPAE
jgi:hypothetical protein